MKCKESKGGYTKLKCKEIENVKKCKNWNVKKVKEVTQNWNVRNWNVKKCKNWNVKKVKEVTQIEM